MTKGRRIVRMGRILGLLWLLAATAAAARDWPTPARLSEQRYRLALLTANALDKSFLPWPVAVGDDCDGPYNRLVADFAARFGPRFDVAAIEARHAQALADIPVERARIIAFTAAATAVVWWLLATICAALSPRPGRS